MSIKIEPSCFGHNDCNKYDDNKSYYRNEDAGKTAGLLAKDICPKGFPQMCRFHCTKLTIGLTAVSVDLSIKIV